MSNYKIARPYAKALFEIAEKDNSLDAWSDMLRMLTVIAQNKTIVELIKNPTISKEQRAALFIEIAKTLTPLAQNFIRILAKSHRLPILPDIAELYEQMKLQAQQVVKVGLTTAVPVDEAYQQRLLQALKRRINGKIDLDMQVDKDILGGAIIHSGDLVIDGSIRGKLAKLSDTLGVYK